MQKLLKTTSVLATVTGIILLAGGIWGVAFTHTNVSREAIVTPSDASIPDKEVRGIFTLKSEADVIRDHTLHTTKGKTYSQMPRVVEKLDEDGETILDEEGNPVMVPNEARNIWITATALMTALHLAIVTYAFSMLIMLLGLISLWNGYLFSKLAKLKA